MLKNAIDLAEQIASKSPVAVQATKASLVYSIDHTVTEGLDHIVSCTLYMYITFTTIMNIILFSGCNK